MVGPPSEGELCVETMKIKAQWLRVGESCKTVPIGCWSSVRGSYAGERFGARTAFGSPGLPVRLRLARRGMEGANWGLDAEAVLCE